MSEISAQSAVSERASVHIDMLRGLAALAVVAGHLRYLFFPPFESLSDPGPAVKAMYFVSSFGHVAVIVFFVLSGYWIAASAGRLPWREFSFGMFAVQRLSRLYVVLVPGLLFTAAVDSLGMYLPRSAAFYRAPLVPFDGFVVAEQFRWSSFVGTLLFRHSIHVSNFGSNAALWSLANEFWYYLFFGLAVVVAFVPRAGAKFLAAVALLAASWFVMHEVFLFRFFLWGLGCGIYWWVTNVRCWHGREAWAGICLATVLALRPLYRPWGENPADLAVALCVAAFLFFLSAREERALPVVYVKAARWISSFSFSLYVVHLPFLVFLRSQLSPGQTFAPTVGAAALALLAFAVTVMLGHGFWWLTERHTPVARAFLRRVLGFREGGLAGLGHGQARGN